ncbi:MAG: glycerol-3-phosphate 1-O-acyltransferase PlsY [Oligosphaeraceae bacterium]
MENSSYFPLFLACLQGYLLGSIPWGLLIGFLNHVDIRTKGSRNIGSTNVTRILGGGWGKICFVMDFLKGYLGVFLGAWLATRLGCPALSLAKLLGGGCAILGHIYPVWLNFKGGKGVATGAGAALGLAFWPVVLGLGVWLFLELRTGVVAIASIAAAIAVLFFSLLFQIAGWESIGWPVVTLIAAMVAIIVYRHKENIQRLLEGKENSFKRKKPAAPAAPERKGN